MRLSAPLLSIRVSCLKHLFVSMKEPGPSHMQSVSPCVYYWGLDWRFCWHVGSLNDCGADADIHCVYVTCVCCAGCLLDMPTKQLLSACLQIGVVLVVGWHSHSCHFHVTCRTVLHEMLFCAPLTLVQGLLAMHQIFLSCICNRTQTSGSLSVYRFPHMHRVHRVQ